MPPAAAPPAGNRIREALEGYAGSTMCIGCSSTGGPCSPSSVAPLAVASGNFTSAVVTVSAMMIDDDGAFACCGLDWGGRAGGSAVFYLLLLLASRFFLDCTDRRRGRWFRGYNPSVLELPFISFNNG